MDSMLQNLDNGNLSDAKRQAKRYSWEKIFRHCNRLYDNQQAALATADFLKGKITFQEYATAQLTARHQSSSKISAC